MVPTTKLCDLITPEVYCGLEFHHESLCRGYVSRKLRFTYDCPAERYVGRFGKGYKVYLPTYESTRYCRVLYLVE